jgi:uncharacterized protein YndB with AHSA1/START domain
VTVQAVEPVVKEIEVGIPPHEAFELFTERMASWWLSSHSIGAEPFADIVIEPRPGGRWFERSAKGTECDWGRVLVWEPPLRLVLAWQLDANWQYRSDVSSELEVSFTAVGEGATRVHLEHRGIEGLGGDSAELRAAFDGEGGWAGLLSAFQAMASA